MRFLFQLPRYLGFARQARLAAVERCQARANQGDSEAQFRLGERYFDGLGVGSNDQQAFSWFLRAAETGHARARNNLGLMLFLGRGTTRDPIEACKWLLLASQQGDEKAAESLVKLSGRVSPEEMDEARRRAHLWQPPDRSGLDTDGSRR